METRVLLERFRGYHKDALGFPYAPIWGKDMKILKDLILYYDMGDIDTMMKEFFREIRTNEFLMKTGATIGVFRTQIPKYLMIIKDRQHAEHRGTLSTRSLEITKHPSVE